LKLEDTFSGSKILDWADKLPGQQIEWAQWLDDRLQLEIPEFRTEDFRPAHLHLYWIKLMFDSLWIACFALEKAFQAWKPRKIFIPPLSKKIHSFDTGLRFRVSLYPSILSLLAEKIHVDQDTSAFPDLETVVDTQ